MIFHRILANLAIINYFFLYFCCCIFDETYFLAIGDDNDRFSHFSPPVISGSHTLQHPSKRQQHEMVSHAHLHQNIRAMGTHTLGRLPSHNHSPTNLIGKFLINIYNKIFYIYFLN